MVEGTDYDEVVVTVLAFADEGAGEPACVPARMTLPRAPYAVLVEPGAVYSRSVAFRVAAVAGGSFVAWTETPAIPWPEEGVQDVVVTLPASCLGAGCDGAVEHCVDGRCEEHPLGNVFEDDCVPGDTCAGAGCLEE
jgi:hypothetical protein